MNKWEAVDYLEDRIEYFMNTYGGHERIIPLLEIKKSVNSMYYHEDFNFQCLQ